MNGAAPAVLSSTDRQRAEQRKAATCAERHFTVIEWCFYKLLIF